MRNVILCLIGTLAVSGAWCPYDRGDVLNCIEKKRQLFDLDGDNALDMHELKTMIRETLPPWSRPFARHLGGAQATMEKCDVDNDGLLTREDFLTSNDTCLSDCWKLMTTHQIFC